MPNLSRAAALASSAAVVLALTTPRGHSQTPAPAAPPPDINAPFQDPDVKAFVSRFETESREVFAKREAIVDALGLKPGMRVADLGAGTGVFTRLIAEKVGPEGKVYAADIAPAFLKHIDEQSRRLGHDHVTTVRATQDSSGLAEGSVDLVFLCDVYHHLEKPPQTLASVHRALRPGGRLVVIDFDKDENKSTDFVKKHVRAPKSVFVAEILDAGFEPLPVPNAPALKENFFLQFRRTDSPAQTPGGK
jgi:predicted methyltransferase